MTSAEMVELAEGLDRAAQAIWRRTWWPEMATGGPMAYAERLAAAAQACRDSALTVTSKEGV